MYERSRNRVFEESIIYQIYQIWMNRTGVSMLHEQINIQYNKLIFGVAGDHSVCNIPSIFFISFKQKFTFILILYTFITLAFFFNLVKHFFLKILWILMLQTAKTARFLHTALSLHLPLLIIIIITLLHQMQGPCEFKIQQLRWPPEWCMQTGLQLHDSVLYQIQQKRKKYSSRLKPMVLPPPPSLISRPSKELAESPSSRESLPNRLPAIPHHRHTLTHPKLDQEQREKPPLPLCHRFSPSFLPKGAGASLLRFPPAPDVNV